MSSKVQRLAVVVFATAVAVFSGALGATDVRPSILSGSFTCIAADDVLARSIIVVQGIVGSSTSSWRTHLSLPQLPADSVSGVTDSNTCQRGGLAFGRNLSPPDTTTSRAVYVIRVGPTRYIVSDTLINEGEWFVHMVFDSSFTTLFGRYDN